MLTVKLLKDHEIPPERMASHAGKICYNASIGDVYTEKLLDVEKQLFNPGHHTTFEHQVFNFEIDGIAISDITFGLHLASPFYNSDQRSGRYSKMFDKPDFNEIKEYITTIYGESKIDDVMNFIEFGYSIFAQNIEKSVPACIGLMKKERSDDTYIAGAAKKIAQEQLRNVVSVSFDTGLLFSIDIPTMVAMYECPLNPIMKKVSEMMKDEFLKLFPEIPYIFRDDKREFLYEKIIFENNNQILFSPVCRLLSCPSAEEEITVPDISDMIPIDKLNYKRKYMENGLIDLKNEIEISVATMGQDQRHRTIKRSDFIFTGNFYSPSIIQALGIEAEISMLMDMWKKLYGEIDNNLFALIAPYGAMVKYRKKSNINALAHEQLKRVCWCAQEEIYNLNRILREQIEKTGNLKLLEVFLPPCMKENGRCYEGERWCRRRERNKNNPCPERKV